MTKFTTAGTLAAAMGLFVAGTADAQIVIGTSPVYAGGTTYYSPGVGVVRTGFAQPYSVPGYGGYNTGYRPYYGNYNTGWNNTGWNNTGWNNGGFNSGYRSNYGGFNSGYRPNYGGANFGGYNSGRSGISIGFGSSRRGR